MSDLFFETSHIPTTEQQQQQQHARTLPQPSW